MPVIIFINSAGMKKLYVILLFLLPLALPGCYKDRGNYDYTDVNEAVIGDAGFDTVYDVRTAVDRLVIRPQIDFTLDAAATGDYSYSWVAVGQNFLRGERFVLGTQRDLDYEVKLSQDSYILYLKIKDNDTGIEFSRGVELNVRSLYSVGLLLAGEDENGAGQMDMISMSHDTIVVHDALRLDDGLSIGPVDLIWVDNNDYPFEERLYVGTASGTYKFDRDNFNAGPYSHLRYSFAFPDESSVCVMNDNQKISDKRQIILVDNYAYAVGDAGMMGSPINTYDNITYFEVAGDMFCNHRQKDVRTFAFYNAEEREFCYVSGLSAFKLAKLGDGEEDTYSWDTKNDFEAGLDFVMGINSFFSGGQSVAVMFDSKAGKYYMYTLTANRSGSVSKNGRYEVSDAAAEFARARSAIMTTNHGYIIYGAGNRLYGLDFRKTPQKCTLLREFDAPITALFNDIVSPEMYDDNFYVATYDDASPRSGVLYKFGMTDSPDDVIIEPKEDWEGLLKVNSIYYKAY